jgi:uncharacterized RDD family membrane protein YckC
MELSNRLQIQGLKKASLAKRAISMTIDDFLISFLVIIAFYDSFENVKNMNELIRLSNSLFLYLTIAYTLYHWIFVAIYGKTIGKMITKTKVIDADTLSTPGWGRALLRSIVRNFDEMFFYLGMFYAVFDSLNRAIHDIAGNSVVVEDN